MRERRWRVGGIRNEAALMMKLFTLRKINDVENIEEISLPTRGGDDEKNMID
jgi:hypothetical protein